MNSRFAAFWARALTTLGMLFVALGVLFAAAALVLDMPWGRITGQAVLERLVAMLVLVVSGVIAGAPLIVIGEMLQVFLDQRRLLQEIKQALDRHRELPRSHPTEAS
jgi:hypothetical protein